MCSFLHLPQSMLSCSKHANFESEWIQITLKCSNCVLPFKKKKKNRMKSTINWCLPAFSRSSPIHCYDEYKFESIPFSKVWIFHVEINEIEPDCVISSSRIGFFENIVSFTSGFDGSFHAVLIICIRICIYLCLCILIEKIELLCCWRRQRDGGDLRIKITTEVKSNDIRDLKMNLLGQGSRDSAIRTGTLNFEKRNSIVPRISTA